MARGRARDSGSGMQAIRLAFGLFFSVITLLGYMAFDFTITNRNLAAAGAERMGFFQYAKGWAGLVGILAAGDADDDAAALPTALAAMMPKAPEGWVARPATPEDAAAFITPDLKGQALETVLAAVTPEDGRGVERLALAYQDDARIVVVELVRYPDIIFTSFMAMASKMQLQMATMQMEGDDFMLVRGMEVRQARLPEGAPARVFLGDVGAQIHLRVLAPATMTDEDMLPFFQTLHVPAMNAGVVEKIPGLGEVPVIVLASVIDEETRKAREAERAAELARLEAERAARDAALEAEERRIAEEAQGITTDEETGVKVRKGTGEGSGKTLGGGGTAIGGGCEIEGSRKVCGSGQPEAEAD